MISNLIRWYFSRGSLPFWCIFLMDCLVLLGADFIVYALNNGALQTTTQFGPLLMAFAIYQLLYIVAFRVFSTYSVVMRYSSFVDLYRIGKAMLLGRVLTLTVKFSLGIDDLIIDVRTRDLAMAALLATLLMWVLRVMVKSFYDLSCKQSREERTFIYGVRWGGIGLAKSIRGQEYSPYRLRGFVADKDDIVATVLTGVKVYPNDEHLVERMAREEARTLLVSPVKNEEFRQNTEMVDRLMAAGIKIMMMPAAQEWDGKSDFAHQLKEIDIEDLLPRQKIEVDMEAIRDQLTGKCVMVTGAAGSIGSEIVRQLAQFSPAKLVLIDQAETPLHDVRLMMARQWSDLEALTITGDICEQQRMEQIFRQHRPDYVFHAAAYKHVPMMEDNPGESIHNNVDGTRIIADLAVKYGAKKFVMVSTDKAVNPTGVMGCSKRICEIYVQSLNQAIREGRLKGDTQFVTTRFGNVLGSNGSVIPLFKEQIRQGGPVTVTHPDIIRYFMLIPEACRLVLEAGTMGNGGEIFVFDMGAPVKIVDLAKRMIKLSGATNVEIAFTGLRDGEKLYEEVLSEQEKTMPTQLHPKIRVAQVRKYDYDDACSQIDEMVAVAYTADAMEIVRRMKRMVPEFKSRHSVYEALD